MNRTAVTVRVFRWDDLPVLSRLCREAEAVDQVGRPGNMDELAERRRRPGVHPEENLFVAQVGEEYAGYVVVQDHGWGGCLVADGLVHPQWRRRGIGSRLFLRAVDRTWERGGRALDIGVRGDRPAAVAFAQHHGLEHVRSMWRMRLEPITGPEITIPAGYGWRESRGEADAEAYCRSYNASFASHWGFSPSTVEEASQRLKHRLTRTFFAVRDGQEVGVCAISPRLGTCPAQRPRWATSVPWAWSPTTRGVVWGACSCSWPWPTPRPWACPRCSLTWTGRTRAPFACTSPPAFASKRNLCGTGSG